MIADRAFMTELFNALDGFMFETEATGDLFEQIKNNYDVAITFVGTHERNPERVIHELDMRFERCDPRYMFVYDHIKECVKRGLVLTHGEYAEMARKFPRCR